MCSNVLIYKAWVNLKLIASYVINNYQWKCWQTLGVRGALAIIRRSTQSRLLSLVTWSWWISLTLLNMRLHEMWSEVNTRFWGVCVCVVSWTLKKLSQCFAYFVAAQISSTKLLGNKNCLCKAKLFAVLANLRWYAIWDLGQEKPTNSPLGNL